MERVWWQGPKVFTQSYLPRTISSNKSFLTFSPGKKVTWENLLDIAQNQGKIKLRLVHPVHKEIDYDDIWLVEEVDGRPVRGLVRTDRIGLSNDLPYLHTQYLLHKIYRDAGGTLEYDEIRVSQMPGLGDPVY